ncbi:MAG: zinc carboxypeptidase [Candidatus Aminicenantes bacterium]|nr:zinc carboxypeptidase [Candidatus Aminicenantes bacterium]
MAKKSATLFFVLLLIPARPLPSGQDPSLPEIVSLSARPSTMARLASLEFDLLGEKNGRVYVAARPKDLARLEAERLPFRYETWSVARAVPGPAVQGGPIGAFHTGPELERDLADLQARFPGLAKITSLGESLEGRPIYALKVSDNAGQDEPEAEFLVLGCHHAREWISVEVPYLFGRALLERYGTDPDIKRLVDQSEIWIVPLVNPDGHDYSVRVYRYWRKNRRANGGGEFGVDINRNYGFKWGLDNQGSSPNPASEVYRGTAAFSEPETRAVRDLFLSRSFRAMVSYHSFSQVILYPWGYTSAPPPDFSTLNGLAQKMAGVMKTVSGRTYALGQGIAMLNYLTNGDTIDWTYGTAGIPSYTIELPPVDQLGGGFFNAEGDIDLIFRENLPALLDLLQWAVDDFAARPAAPLSAFLDRLRPRLGFPRR